MEHVLSDIMGVTMEKIKEMVDVDTIVGKPITAADGSTIIPISKVSFGFASGGTDFSAKSQGDVRFGGGSGSAITINPVAFLVVAGGNVKLLPVAAPSSTSVDRIIDSVPELIEKITGMIKDRKGKKDKQDSGTEAKNDDDPIEF